MSEPQPNRKPAVATRSLAAVVAGVILLALGAPSAQASALVRFVHAVPGVGSSQLNSQAQGASAPVGAAVSFTQATRYRRVPAGSLGFSLDVVEDPSGPIARERLTLSDRTRYTVVAMGTQRRAVLRLFRDGGAAGGVARIRLIHAVPELGRADVRVGRRLWGPAAGFMDATPYRSARPGRYTVRVTRPGQANDVLASGEVTVTAGSAFTGLVVGSAGEPLRLVLLEDRAVTPRGAPQTGLGGLSASSSAVPAWVVLAALLVLAASAGLVNRRRHARR